jgi:uncharacterized circularly permuted ATP-grasp superfamily protein/uncharacterized alpha-E superfamily protein
MSSQPSSWHVSTQVDCLLPGAAPASNGVWDELRDASGQLREPWRRFAQLMGADAGELDRRSASVADQVRADGITHNVYGGEGAAARAWPLELLPQLLAPEDWRCIERGVSQRARLYEAMLHDIYGAQRLLQEALLPAPLLFRHAGFLRPLIGVVPPLGVRQFIVAFDLARGADGRWWVVSQRTQNPSGLGYVMHNRLIVSRLFPDAFREMRVQHLASAYRRMLDTVEAAAAEVARAGTPRIALLTPGPYNETYFEQAYLARYLGLPLVEGGDLTVRDERLYLRTVEGLEPVHALLRRLDDDYCDPLELRADSALGVPGLVQAVRAGHVVLANALGSAFLESPAVQGFLPAIVTRLLGEELLMPSLPTWWCGEQAAWDDVRTALPDKVIRPTYLRGGGQAHALHDDASRASWTRRVDADPDAFTVQGRVALSEAPVWQGSRVVMRPAVLRVYALAGHDGQWHVLPGGMTRVAAEPGASVSMQYGGRSLDTWVLSDTTVDHYSMLPQRLSVDDVARRRRPVASRTAENLFWLGRYTERAEQLVRLARSTIDLIDTDAVASPQVRRAVSGLALASGLVPPGTPTLTQAPHLFERAMLGALDGRSVGVGVGFNLRAVARTVEGLRERLSPEHWSQVQAMADDFTQRMAPLTAQALPHAQQARAALAHLAVQLAAVTGAQTDRMTRDNGWRLLTAGRLIERLLGTTRQLRELVDPAAVGAHAGPAIATATGFDLLLALADSAITYRARYQRHADLLALVDLLVLDDTNPRAWAGVLRRLRTELRKLPGSPTVIDALLARLPAQSAGLALEELRGVDDEGICERLVVLADGLIDGASRLADDIGLHYFAHTPGGDQLLSS